MRLQAASRKEVSRISVGVLIGDVLMVAGLFLLSQLGVGKFEIGKILLGAFLGSLIAIVNFIILCLTVQSALEIESKRKMQARFQFSYNARLAIQAVWIVAAFLLRDKMPIHPVAAALPVFFPQLWLIYLQLSGKLNVSTAAPAQPTETEESQQ